jgi:hypothetical protein
MRHMIRATYLDQAIGLYLYDFVSIFIHQERLLHKGIHRQDDPFGCIHAGSSIPPYQ